jgi:hypothetical protein
MGSFHDADDAPFGAAFAGVGREFDQNLIAVHCFGDIRGRDEDIAIQALAGFAIQRADETKAVAVHGEASGDEIAIDGRGGDGVAVARNQNEFAAHDEIGKEGFQFLALAATQREFADELLVAGGTLRLVVNVLEQIAFRDHSPML